MHKLFLRLGKLPIILLLILILVLFASVLSFVQPQDIPLSITTLEEMSLSKADGSSSTLSLPCQVSYSDALATFSLSTYIYPNPEDFIYIKTAYSPIRVLFNGVLLYEYGQPGSYPAFLLDPPTDVELIPLPSTTEGGLLEIYYSFPTQREVLSLYPIQLGSPYHLVLQQVGEGGASFFFALILIGLGLLLLLLALVVTRFEKAGTAFLWLGLFALDAGLWFFGECDVAGLLIPNPPFLYVCAFLGLFTMAIPLLRFGITILALHTQRLLQIACQVLEVAVAIAVVLQLLGICALSRSMYVFHVLAPAALLLFSGCILWDAFVWKNTMAKRFIFPICQLALFTLLELANYYFLRLDVQFSSFFQIGALIFIFIVSLLCGHFIRNILDLRSKNRQLAYELSLSDKQMEAQKSRYALLSEMASALRKQRHDLRHQLAVIQSFNNNGERDKLNAYLQELLANIPSNEVQQLCDNEVVNAVAYYYYDLAKKQGIQDISIQLSIPADTGQILASDLCVVVGNLLENAITACAHVPPGQARIQMRSRQRFDILALTLDNSYAAVEPAEGGLFRSTKPGGGTGLTSIRSIAEKYQGGAEFTVKDGLFCSSIYMRLR